MSGYEDYSDVLGGNGQEETGGGLRKMLEEALAMNKKLVERLEGQDRTKTVLDLFKEKGIDPKVAELMGKDADPAQWLEQYGSLFQGGGSTLDAPPVEVDGQVVTPPVVDQTLEDTDLQAEREAYEAVMGAQSSGAPSKITLDAVEKIKSFDNEADLMKYINSGGQEG